MALEAEQMEPAAAEEQSAQPESDQRAAAPIESRFLFVDVSAQRAKQLRRGALSRLRGRADSATPHKLERIAMEEVRQGYIDYTLPTVPRRRGDTA